MEPPDEEEGEEEEEVDVMAFVRSIVSVPESMCFLMTASAADDDGAWVPKAQIRFCGLVSDESTGIVNVKLGVFPWTFDNDGIAVAILGGELTTEGVTSAGDERCESVIEPEPAGSGHMITMGELAMVFPKPIDIQAIVAAPVLSIVY